VSDLEAKTWIEAAQSYVRLRRRYWRCFFGMPGLLVLLVFGAAISAFEHGLSPSVRGILLSLFIVAWCACWLGSLVTWFTLVGFRCPRCGKRFIMSWWSSWPSDRCKHCGLDLGPTAMATAKPLAAAGLWEREETEREDTHQSRIVPTRSTRDPMWDQHVDG
jgi:hypothetical protein